MGKIIVGKTFDVTPGKMIKASIDGKDILVTNVDGTYYAIDDTCTHAGASLAEGKLDECTVTCGWHGAQFDCKSGSLTKFPAKIRDLETYTISVESDDIFVEI